MSLNITVLLIYLPSLLYPQLYRLASEHSNWDSSITTRKHANSDGYIRRYCRISMKKVVGMISSEKKSSSKIRDENPRETNGYFRRTTDDSFRRDILHRKFVGHISDWSDHWKNNSDEMYLSEISDERVSSEMSDHNSVGIVRQISDEICGRIIRRTCFRRFFLFIIIIFL